jgi:hypothetical protein
MSFFVYGFFTLVALDIIDKTIGVFKGNTTTVTTKTYNTVSEAMKAGVDMSHLSQKEIDLFLEKEKVQNESKH